MLVLLFASILAVLFSFLQSKGKMKNGLKWGMVIVTVIAAIHYNYGSDYMAYLNDYLNFIGNHYSIDEVLAGGVIRNDETGWAVLYWLFGHLGMGGFFLLIAFMSIVQGIVVYKLINRFVPVEWYPFAVFVYLFSVTLYVGSFSGMRQHFAMCIVGLTLPLILEKRFLLPALLVFIASQIHSSAIIFLPFVFWGYIPNKSYKSISILYLILFIFFFLNGDVVNQIFEKFFEYESFENYIDYSYDEKKNLSLGLGFIVGLIPFVLSLTYLLKAEGNNEEQNKIVSLATIGMMIIPFSFVIGLASRVAYYFNFFSIVSLPFVYKRIPNKNVKLAVLVLYVMLSLYSYIGYFYSDIRYDSTFYYHSIFELL